MIGRVVFKGMPLEDSTIAISNTTQLNKLIGITSGYLELKYEKINKFITKLIIAMFLTVCTPSILSNKI